MFLCDHGFLVSKSDTSVFYFKDNKVTIYFLVYVDDFLITSNSEDAIGSLLGHLSKAFPVKDLGYPSFFLGVEIQRTAAGLHLKQERYIKDLLIKTKMLSAKPLNTPMVSSEALVKTTDDLFDDPTLYRQTVGSLQYLSLTQPDVSFSVNKLCQFMHSPSNKHWQAVKRVLRYLVGTQDIGILLRSISSSQLLAYSDSDWAACPDDRRSTSGYVVYLGCNPIAWGSRKQVTVARSSTEVELRALAATVTDIMWIQSLCFELGIHLPCMPKVMCDNVSTLYVSANPVLHSRMNHVQMDFHFIREKVARHDLCVQYIPTSEQIADTLTKPLSRHSFLKFRDKLCASLKSLSV